MTGLLSPLKGKTISCTQNVFGVYNRVFMAYVNGSGEPFARVYFSNGYTDTGWVAGTSATTTGAYAGVRASWTIGGFPSLIGDSYGTYAWVIPPEISVS